MARRRDRRPGPTDFYVYVLFRHDSGQPFYVGKGCGDRWMSHDRPSVAKQNPAKQAIIKAALDAGCEIPRVKIAEGLTEAQAFDVERSVIVAIGRSWWGGPLVNLTDGGEGEAGRIFSPEHRAKLSAARKGVKHSEESKRRIADAMKRPDVVERMSGSQKRRFEDPEERRKTGLKSLGRKRTPEAALKQKLNNPGHTGHTHSPEARAKIRAARWPHHAQRRAALSQEVQ